MRLGEGALGRHQRGPSVLGPRGRAAPRLHSVLPVLAHRCVLEGDEREGQLETSKVISKVLDPRPQELRDKTGRSRRLKFARCSAYSLGARMFGCLCIC